jgi:hypothetical protein
MESAIISRLGNLVVIAGLGASPAGNEKLTNIAFLTVL